MSISGVAEQLVAHDRALIEMQMLERIDDAGNVVQIFGWSTAILATLVLPF